MRLLASFLIGCCCAPPMAARQEQATCGTHALTTQEQMFLHRQAVRQRRARTVLSAAPAAVTYDAGNIAVMDDAAGVVERRNDFDLDGRTLTFQPGAGKYRYALSGTQTYDAQAAALGTRVADLGDDDTRAFDLPFRFPFYGASYQRVYVNSDGNLTFGAGDSASTDRNTGRMAYGPPRIAPLFTDLDPGKARDGVRVLAEPGRWVASWSQVPVYDTVGLGALQTFQVRLYPDGRIEFSWAGASASSAVVGISPGGAQGQVDLVSFSGDASGEYGNTVAERFTQNLEIDLQVVTQRFYAKHDDAYDYVVVYNNMDIDAGASAVAYCSAVRRKQQGTAAELLDVGREFGSPLRLQAVMNMGQTLQYPVNPRGVVPKRSTSGDTPLSILAHEAGHLNLAYASIRDPNDAAARPVLGYQNAHWYFAFNSEASLLEGNRIQDRGPGASPRFLTTGAVQAYSPLDRYLMGYGSADEVTASQTMFVVNGAPASYARRLPQTGVSFDGTRRDISIDEIIQTEGRRTPDYTVAQRRFRFAFVLIVPAGTQPGTAELQQVETYRQEFEKFYAEASGSRGSADTTLKRALQLSLAPAAGVLQGRDGSGVIRLQAPVSAPLTVSLVAANGLVNTPRAVTVPAGASSVAFTFTGTRAGVEDLSAVPADSAFETAVAKVQVTSLDAVKLSVVSSDAGAVQIRVTDVNEIPYPGARVVAAVSNGEPATPTAAITDEAGLAAFRWSAGAASQLTLYLEGGTPASGVTLTAAGPVLINAVVNAASYAQGITANSFASLFGGNLASGETHVSLNGREVRTTYVSAEQVNFYVPADTPLGRAQIVVTNAAGTSSTARTTVFALQPGIFVGIGLGDGLLSLYCTGMGALAPPVNGLQSTVVAPAVLVGGIPATVLYSGGAPGYPGLYQINARISPQLLPGTLTASVIMNGVASNQVKLEVR